MKDWPKLEGIESTRDWNAYGGGKTYFGGTPPLSRNWKIAPR